MIRVCSGKRRGVAAAGVKCGYPDKRRPRWRSRQGDDVSQHGSPFRSISTLCGSPGPQNARAAVREWSLMSAGVTNSAPANGNMPPAAHSPTGAGWRPGFLHPVPWLTWSPAGQWLLVAIVWTVVALLSYTRFLIDQYNVGAGRAALAWLAPWIVCFLPWMLVTPFLAAVVMKYPLLGEEWKRSLLVQLSLAVPVSFIAAVVGHLADSGLHLFGAPGVVWHLPDLFFHFLLYLGTIGVLQGTEFMARLRQREQQLAALTVHELEMENSLRDAQLSALRAKLNPHFFFNALQNISAMMRNDVAGAEKMLVRLSDLLRTALRLDLTQEISLQEELQLTQAYLDIERVRFQDRLTVRVDVEPDLKAALVPSLMLQPIAENAIRHGIGDRRDKARVEIGIRRDGPMLCIRVCDNGAGFSSPDALHFGVGLDVLHSRLDKLYSGAGFCELRNRDEGGAEVEIRIPYRTATYVAGGNA